jgi:hypothetical protein
MQVSFHWINDTCVTWYHGTKIINDANAFKGYVGLVVVLLLEASLLLGASGRHASRHTIINLMGRSNNYCSYSWVHAIVAVAAFDNESLLVGMFHHH